MVRVPFLVLCGSLGLATFMTGQSKAAEDPTGYWATEKNESQIHITHCGEDKICGSIFWMKEPVDAKGQPKVDKENEDEAKRKRPILGLQLINMTADDEIWRGTVYNPTNGKTYDATLKTLSKTQVELKGCVAYILCGGQKWTREEPKIVGSPDMAKGVAHADATHAAVSTRKVAVPAPGVSTSNE